MTNKKSNDKDNATAKANTGILRFAQNDNVGRADDYSNKIARQGVETK